MSLFTSNTVSIERSYALVRFDALPISVDTGCVVRLRPLFISTGPCKEMVYPSCVDMLILPPDVFPIVVFAEPVVLIFVAPVIVAPLAIVAPPSTFNVPSRSVLPVVFNVPLMVVERRLAVPLV